MGAAAGSLKMHKIGETDKSSARLSRKKGSGLKSIELEVKKVTTDVKEIQKTIRDYYKQLYTNKMDNPEETDQFLEKVLPSSWTREKWEIQTDQLQALKLKLWLKKFQQTEVNSSQVNSIKH